MKIKLTKEIISQMISDEKKKIEEKYNSDLQKLNEKYKVGDEMDFELITKQKEVVTKKSIKDFTQEELVELFKTKKNKEISDLTGYNAGYVSILRKKYGDK